MRQTPEQADLKVSHKFGNEHPVGIISFLKNLKKDFNRSTTTRQIKAELRKTTW